MQLTFNEMLFLRSRWISSSYSLGNALILKKRVYISNANVSEWVEVVEWKKDDPFISITIIWIISFRERELKLKIKVSYLISSSQLPSPSVVTPYLNRYTFNFIFTNSCCIFPNWWTNVFAPCCSRSTSSACWAESKIWRKKSPFQSFLPCSRYLDIKSNCLLKSKKFFSISPPDVGNTKQSRGLNGFFFSPQYLIKEKQMHEWCFSNALK